MVLLPLAATYRIFRFVPPAVVWPYLAVAVAMAVVLLARFRAQLRRRRTPRGAAAVTLAAMCFPLLAVSMAWPVSLPAVLIVLYNERRTKQAPPERKIP